MFVLDKVVLLYMLPVTLTRRGSRNAEDMFQVTTKHYKHPEFVLLYSILKLIVLIFQPAVLIIRSITF